MVHSDSQLRSATLDSTILLIWKNILETPSAGKNAENILRDIVTGSPRKRMIGLKASGEAAFYGPKLDFMGKDAFGRCMASCHDPA